MVEDFDACALYSTQCGQQLHRTYRSNAASQPIVSRRLGGAKLLSFAKSALARVSVRPDTAIPEKATLHKGFLGIRHRHKRHDSC